MGAYLTLPSFRYSNVAIQQCSDCSYYQRSCGSEGKLIIQRIFLYNHTCVKIEFKINICHIYNHIDIVIISVGSF